MYFIPVVIGVNSTWTIQESLPPPGYYLLHVTERDITVQQYNTTVVSHSLYIVCVLNNETISTSL